MGRFPPAGPDSGPEAGTGEIRRSKLLELDLGSSLFELGLGGLGIVFAGSFKNRRGCTFDQLLGVGETQSGSNFTHSLNDGDFVSTGFGKNDIKFGLLFRGSIVSTTATAGCGDCDGSCGADAPFLFEVFYQFGGLQNGKLAELFCNFCNV